MNAKIVFFMVRPRLLQIYAEFEVFSFPPGRSAPQACPVESNCPSKPVLTCASRYSITPKPQLPAAIPPGRSDHLL